ncbi:MAG: hypothetical protein JRN06_05595 [Nitrososphaerota archaeon]|nr:hypothetical protein [Nitrososphaerota archaeon]
MRVPSQRDRLSLTLTHTHRQADKYRKEDKERRVSKVPAFLVFRGVANSV